MASEPIPPLPSSHAVGFHSPESASLWARLSTYVSENKVVAYTIGAVVIVAGAGGIYYITQSSQSGGKGKKRERRADKGKGTDKDKKEAEGMHRDSFIVYWESPLFLSITARVAKKKKGRGGRD